MKTIHSNIALSAVVWGKWIIFKDSQLACFYSSLGCLGGGVARGSEGLTFCRFYNLVFFLTIYNKMLNKLYI